MDNEEARHEYALMREQQTTRQVKWVSAYNRNPELASAFLDVFDMPEEDCKLILRMLNSMKDSLRIYRADIKPKKKPKTTTIATV